MQHAWARQTIPLLLAGNGLGPQALVVMLAAGLHERLPGRLSDGLWARVASLPPEHAAPWSGPANQLPVPADASELLAQLAPLAVQHPGDTGLTLGLLTGLADLWPHVSSEERPLLRTRFHNGLMERAAEVGSRGHLPRAALVTTAELRVWNRYMPTATGDEDGAADLSRLLTAPTAQVAYHLLGGHLIGGVEFAVLARILGSLALQVADQRADPQGVLLHPLVGAVAAERLAAITPPEAYSTLLMQLGHQLWWCANDAGLVKRNDEPSSISLADAILGGTANAARRRARLTRLDEDGWWDLLTPVALELARDPATDPTGSIIRGDPVATAPAPRGLDRLRRVITCVWVLAARSHQRTVIPDDVAALAAMLADGA